MNFDNLFREVFNLDENFNLEGVSPDVLPEWDSLGHLTLISRIEEVYQTTFTFDEMIEIEDYNDIVKVLKLKGVI